MTLRSTHDAEKQALRVPAGRVADVSHARRAARKPRAATALYVASAMIPSAPTVTVTGPDRSGLLANLTVRFGRVEVLGERQVTLPDGTAGWELTVRHESFTAARGGGGAGAPSADDRAEAGDVRDAARRARLEVDAAARAEIAGAEALAAEREQLLAQLETERAAMTQRAQADAATIRNQAAAEIQAGREEVEAERAGFVDEAAQLRAAALAEAEERVAEGAAAAQAQIAAAREQAQADVATAGAAAEQEVAEVRKTTAAQTAVVREEAELAVQQAQALVTAERKAAAKVKAAAGEEAGRLRAAAERDARKLRDEAKKLRDESGRQVDALLAKREAETVEAVAKALRAAQGEAREIVTAAQAQRAELKRRAEAELAAARVEVREQLRAARDQSMALLAAARDEADTALAEGKALTGGLKDVVDRVRDLGRQLDQEVVAAHRTLAGRTQLAAVQAKSRAEQPDLDAAATAIAAHVVRILSEDHPPADAPGDA